MKFQKYKIKNKKNDKSESKTNKLSKTLALNYNKNALESIKIFKNIADKRQQNKKLRKPKNESINIETHKDFNFDHNMEILNFNQSQKNRTKFYWQQYGISFNTPAYIKFEPPSRRVRERLLLEKKKQELNT